MTVALILLPDASAACDACQSRASGSPVLSLNESWHLKLLAGYTERVNCIRHLTLGTHNNINRKLNLFPIYHLKWRTASAFCHS